MRALVLLLILCWATSVFAQDRLTGQVRDRASSETLIGATVYPLPAGPGTTTNAYGFFGLQVPEGTQGIVVSYLGYRSDTLSVEGPSPAPLEIYLTPSGAGLETVVVTAANARSTRVDMATTRLSMMAISRLPRFAGEADLIKALQTTAGVKNNSEGSSGMFVRGGGGDQNLILLDEARIYNPAHLLGLVSIFNVDALKDVQLHKGAFPARFGGRTASVLEIRSKDGDLRQRRWSGGLSPLTARLSVTTPLIIDKLGLMAGLRRSLFDLFVEPGVDIALEPRFMDANLSAQLRIGTTDRLILSGYYGRDRLRSERDFDNSWGNRTGSLRYVRQFSERWFGAMTLAHSDYHNDLRFTNAGLDFNWRNALTSTTAKVDFSYYGNNRQRFYLGGGDTRSSLRSRQRGGSGQQHPGRPGGRAGRVRRTRLVPRTALES